MICYFQKDFLKIEEHMEMHLNANHCSRETQMLKVFSIKALFLYKLFFLRLDNIMFSCYCLERLHILLGT